MGLLTLNSNYKLWTRAESGQRITGVRKSRVVHQGCIGKHRVDGSVDDDTSDLQKALHLSICPTLQLKYLSGACVQHAVQSLTTVDACTADI